MATRSSYTTTYTDGAGNTVHATTHLTCEGKGCAACNGLGFTKDVIPAKPRKTA